MAKDDYYSILGISRDAKDTDIKRAYRRLARRNHPDLNPGDKSAEERFKRMQQAYDVLSDPRKRAVYDQYGFYSDNLKDRPADGGPGSGEWRSQGFDFSGMDSGGSGQSSFRDIFSEIFGSGSKAPSSGPERGEDLEHHLNISFIEGIRGISTRLTIDRHDPCATCSGSGLDPTKKQQVCPTCRGSGVEVKSGGMMQFSASCRTCGGLGQTGVACSVCGGSGRMPVQESITVRIPPGVDTGFRMRVPRKGGGGKHGGPPGDLYLIITILPHSFFRREGNDILCTVPITVTEAALGTKIEVPTIDGKSALRIPPGTQSGQKFRLRGKGAPSLRGEVHGNQIVEVRVVIPKIADERSKEILRELARLNPEDLRANIS